MFTLQLTRIRDLSESTRDFRFVREDGEALDYQPGQFYRFVFEDQDGEFERSYSLCNFEELFGDHLDLVISKVEGGRATRLLFDCDVGLTARVTGPFGRLILPESDPGRLIMVATSVGLAPYMPILKELTSRRLKQVVLLLGVRDRSEFIYGDLLRDYASQHEFFDLRFCISREEPQGNDEYSGYVTAQLETLDVNKESDHVLLCGNPAMVDDAWRYLKEKRFSTRQVIREKYVYARESKVQKTKSSATLTDEQKKLIAEKMKKYT